MSIALTDDHRALAEVAASFLTNRDVLGAARGTLEAPVDSLPPFWGELCGLGWTGLHLPEEHGGQGYGMAELAVIAEQLGRLVGPGPFLPTVVASGVIAASGNRALCGAVLPGLAAGTTIGAVALGGPVERTTDGRLRGDAGPVLGAAVADLLLIPVGADLVVVAADDPGVHRAEAPGIDPTRRFATVRLDGASPLPDGVLPGGRIVATTLARVLAAAEASGGARACTEAAVTYAGVREQFGRPIGSFQAVKHHAANMFVDTELAAAAAWDAARCAASGSSDVARLAAAVAATQAIPAFRRCSEVNIQIHGGIGYTWEHDAHLYLRRASALAALIGSDTAAPLDVFDLAATDVEPELTVELPEEAERFRAEARSFRDRYDALPRTERRAALIDSGYFMPHWPVPFGRAASAVEQIVIEQELSDLEQPDLGIGAWVVLTLLQHGTPDQVERWVRPSLDGELRWCQLFSEPNAGSDAAAITTRATRVDGGWSITGQKVWTSEAHACNRGLATVRTDPDAPKHAGVTTVAIDMHAPGVEVRPLRELTGETLFNEVFFEEVLVPDDDVVGDVNGGWAVARATLGNERVSIGGSKSSLGLVGATDLVALAKARAPGDTGLARDVGRLVAEDHTMAVLNLRQVARAVSGAPAGPEGNVTKLLSAEHAQRVGELGLSLLGQEVGTDEGARVMRTYLFSRCLTIAGGTSEIVRNLIAERILGLPR